MEVGEAVLHIIRNLKGEIALLIGADDSPFSHGSSMNRDTGSLYFLDMISLWYLLDHPGFQPVGIYGYILVSS